MAEQEITPEQARDVAEFRDKVIEGATSLGVALAVMALVRILPPNFRRQFNEALMVGLSSALNEEKWSEIPAADELYRESLQESVAMFLNARQG